MSSNGSQQVLYSTRIDLSADIRSKVIELLNQTLAATLDLKTQVKQAHWNVKGSDFYQLHLLFDEMAGELEAYIDLVAERITTIAGVALGTARIAAANSILPEYPLTIFAGKEHIIALADRYAAYAKHLRAGIDTTAEWGDADTADLYTEVSRTIDMRLWFLEAHLQDEAIPIHNGAKISRTATKTAASENGARSTTKRSTAKTATTKTATAKAAKTTTTRKPRAKSK